MNINERILDLALKATEDTDYAAPLVDLILEADWWHPVFVPPREGWPKKDQIPWMSRNEFVGAVHHNVAGLESRCRAIAAVLLFDGWQNHPWWLALWSGVSEDYRQSFWEGRISRFILAAETFALRQSHKTDPSDFRYSEKVSACAPSYFNPPRWLDDPQANENAERKVFRSRRVWTQNP